MRRLSMNRLAAVLLVVLSFPVSAQEFPVATEEGQAALEELIRHCADAGGLRLRRTLFGLGPSRLEVADAVKLEAAVAAAPEELTPELRDALVVRWSKADEGQEAAIVALLRSMASASHDGLTAAYADAFEALQIASESPREAIRLFNQACRRFHAAGKRDWEAVCYDNLAAAQRELGDAAAAVQGHQKALEISRDLYGERHPDVATSYNNLAAAQRKDR